MASPTATLTNNISTTGAIQVAWTNSGQAGTWFAYRLYVREFGSPVWTMVREFTTNSASYTYDLYAFPANSIAEVAVVEVTNDVNGFDEGAYNVASVATTGGYSYLLVHPTDANLNVDLNHVTGDTANDVDEVGTFTLIGRGRKVDRGTRLGFEGTLSATLYPTPSATVREQWNALAALREGGCGAILIRSPFGDVIKASITAISRDRIAAGNEDYMTIQITYVEVS